MVDERIPKWVPGALFVAAAGYLLRIAIINPGRFSDFRTLGGLLLIQLILLAAWKYEQRYFPLLILVFLSAGIDVPFSAGLGSARWLVLGAGAIAGLALYLQKPNHNFGAFHVVAFACVVSAFVSAVVSDHPHTALLKAVSLLLLFVYGSTGARLAIVDHEGRFLSRFLISMEVMAYITAFCYFVLHYHFWGNPNSLGVAMGVVAFPMLLWGVLVSDQRRLYRRRLLALTVCVVLLLSSYSRAAMAAAVVTSILLCIGLRKYRFLMGGAAAALLAAAFVAAFVPALQVADVKDASLSDRFLYKGKPQAGVLASRTPVWDRTIQSLRMHPWFGTGFGTSDAEPDRVQRRVAFGMVEDVFREHGSSYLAIMEWAGLLGVTPFLGILIFTAINIGRVFEWMRSTGSPLSSAVPIACIAAGALVDAGFEDWLFAVGYHASVLFWFCAFVLPELIPARIAIARYPVVEFPVTVSAGDAQVATAGR